MGHIASRTPGIWFHISWDSRVVVQTVNPLHALCAALVQQEWAALGVAVVAAEFHLEGDLVAHHLLDIGRALVLDDSVVQVVVSVRIHSSDVYLANGFWRWRFRYTLHIDGIPVQEVVLDLITRMMSVHAQVPERVVLRVKWTAAAAAARYIRIIAGNMKPRAKLT